MKRFLLVLLVIWTLAPSLCLAKFGIGVSPARLRVTGTVGQPLELTLWVFNPNNEAFVVNFWLKHNPEWLNGRSTKANPGEWTSIRAVIKPTKVGNFHDSITILVSDRVVSTAVEVRLQIGVKPAQNLWVGISIIISIILFGLLVAKSTKKFKSYRITPNLRGE